MKQTKRFYLRPAMAVALCVLLIVACMSVAYAADVGGIQQTVKIWINGASREAHVVETGDGGYTFVVQTGRVEVVRGGGGVAFDEDGSQHTLSPEEVAEQFATEVVPHANGTVWLHHFDQAYDITNLFAEGVCKVSLEVDGEILYFDIVGENGSYGFSRDTQPDGVPADYTRLR